MTEEEKVRNCVDARLIREKLLEALHLTAGELAKATGIGYQRIYDLGSGRTQKFNPGVVRAITKAFPRVNPHFLYSGDGPVLLPESEEDSAESTSSLKRIGEMLQMQNRLMLMMEKIAAKQAELIERELRLMQRERELLKREAELKGLLDK